MSNVTWTELHWTTMPHCPNPVQVPGRATMKVPHKYGQSNIECQTCIDHTKARQASAGWPLAWKWYIISSNDPYFVIINGTAVPRVNVPDTTKKDNSKMLDIQAKAFAHLTASGGSTALRKQALEDLIETGFFNTNLYLNDAKVKMETYLQRNPRGFCEDGIKRFKQAVGLPVVKTRVQTFLVTLEFPEDASYRSYGVAPSDVVHDLNKSAWATAGRIKATAVIHQHIRDK